MILWPAIIKYKGDSELTFIASASEWERDADLRSGFYDDDDLLIDSAGKVYTLQNRSEGSVTPSQSGTRVEKEEIVALIKAHFSATGSCCVSKFSVSTVAEGIESLRETG